MNDIASILEREVRIDIEGAQLPGTLAAQPAAIGIVLFAHGSGSSRFSQRNRFVARTLQEAGIATLLFDLLTVEESRIDTVTAEYRFDIPLLTRRLAETVHWVRRQPELATLPMGLFGASTGAAAALSVAAWHPETIAAVVSRGGRPDLARGELDRVTAPTLLIVGGNDRMVLPLNREAARALAQSETAVVPGASHLFEEPGALEQVAKLARDWFKRYLEAPQE